MRYMMMIKATKDYEAGIPPSQELMAGMGKLTEEMMEAGVCSPPTGSNRVQGHAHQVLRREEYRNRWALCRDEGADRRLRDSPGEVEGRAIELADRVVEVHIKAGITEFEMEIRLLFDPAEFGSREPVAWPAPGPGRAIPELKPYVVGEHQ